MYASRSLAILTAFLTVALSVAWAADKDSDKKDKDKDDPKLKEDAGLGDVHAEVTVLHVIHELRMTTAQLKKLKSLAAKTSQKPPARKVFKVTEKFSTTMSTLRDVLGKADDDKIDETYEALDALRENENPDFEEVELTSEARKYAPDILKMLSARQVALYLATVADDFPDPGERLHGAIEESRKLTGNKWTEVRDDVAYQVGWLIGGLEEKKEESIRKKATSLLTKAHNMSDKEFKEDKDDLTKAIKELVGKLEPTDIHRHFMQRLLAEVLSNHRLSDAVDRRLKNAK